MSYSQAWRNTTLQPMEWLDAAIFGWSGKASVTSPIKTADEADSDAEDQDYDDGPYIFSCLLSPPLSAR